MVFIPSCAGDVFIGSGNHVYRKGRQHLTIHYRGWANAEAALTWTFDHVKDAEQVFLTGESAGSAGSVFHAPEVIDHYQQARVTQLGDSLALLSATPLRFTEFQGLDHLPSWLKSDPDLRPGSFTMVAFMLRLMKHYPDVSFARFNFDADQVQARFYASDGGKASTFTPALRQAEKTLMAGSSRYRSFLACGAGHTILGWRRFYSFVQQGVLLVDWVRRLANGIPIQSTACRR
jgi:hypothetical protein